MATAKSKLLSDELLPETAPLRIPRLASLLHRVQHAKDADGNPVELLDELMFLLDDPPPGTHDRWQSGADLCAQYGIATSRMSVWRLYRARIIQWRREQNPEPPTPPPNAQEIARLQDHVRHLAVQRMLEMLNNPNLTATELIGILRSDLRRQNHQLARDQFEHRRHREQVQQDRFHNEQTLRNALDMRRIKIRQQNQPPSPPIPPHPTA